MDKGFIRGRKYDILEESIVFRKKALDGKAELALLMIERWGMVQGYIDGEDSAGRAKVGLMPIDNLIERAFESAEKAFAEIERRQWSMEIPPPTIKMEK